MCLDSYCKAGYDKWAITETMFFFRRQCMESVNIFIYFILLECICTLVNFKAFNAGERKACTTFMRNIAC